MEEGPPENAEGLAAAELFTLLGRAHTLEVLYTFVVATDPPLRFSELQEHVDVPANSLSRRLEELVEAGLLTRESYDEIPPRVEYEPTRKLYDLEPTFRALEPWMVEYGAEDLGLPEEL